jgi:hypothetical protein
MRYHESKSRGFRRTCNHIDAPAVPALVIDPFVGSGTTLIAARKLGRRAVGIDLSLPYLRDIARARLGLTALEAWTTGKPQAAAPMADAGPLFEEH